MAGGKLSPRQKMINMMYLVLTAMLALNVSKDILKALEKLDQNMAMNVTTVESGNANLYDMLDRAAAEKERAKEPNRKAKELKPKAEELVSFIADIKDQLIEETGGTEDGHMKGSDNRDVPTRLLVTPKNLGGGGLAAELKSKLEDYKAWLIENAGENQEMINSINSTFDLSNRKEDGEDTPRSWEEATFAELPLAGIVPFLTDIQASVRRAESNMLEELAKEIDAGTIKVTGVKAVVQAKSTYVTTGNQYEAEVFLAAFDANQEPIFTLDGENVAAENISGGQAHITIPANSVGEKTHTGMISLPGSDAPPVPFEIVYTVAPSSVVVSPTAMNVLYRQVSNPIAVSVPGVEPERLVVTGPGIRQTGSGTYEAVVTNVSGTEATITVGVKEDDGTTRPAGTQKFRIKGLPPAQAMIFGRSTSGPYSANAIGNAPIEAKYVDFPFNLNLTVRSFELVVPGEAPFQIQGTQMTSAAKSALSAARPGSTIIIRNVKAVISGSGEQVRNIGQLSLDLN
ncbi:type IX secretion system motor protein PorM/GldM [Phaeocystidibacter marisrubri]|uniref:Gliding motility protein GldM n=1 Tax=Phaeocystidibacter marisrubri TaxID=1577780 RepID=A0A6L3ZG74_9FLAO|nr:gliding motility protein GldM [Phaeocystidibacter marisrubri]KAB2816854.1 gliding motility protein GldM [Phaeocystidibacter marisrubri]GGH77869.1 gliding motility protein GldM [Phaeocystidibacter marisrubri]